MMSLLTRSGTRPLIVVLCAALVLGAFTACVGGGADGSSGTESTGDSGGPNVFTDDGSAADSTAARVAAIPERTVTALPASRLADGLIPPTNKWFSGLVFGEGSMPVFPLPLSFQLTSGGYAFGLPTVTAAPNVITGGLDRKSTRLNSSHWE